MTKEREGRIIRSLSGFYEVQTEDGTVTCRARGNLRRGSAIPQTGDVVTISAERGKGICRGRRERDFAKGLQSRGKWWIIQKNKYRRTTG